LLPKQSNNSLLRLCKQMLAKTKLFYPSLRGNLLPKQSNNSLLRLCKQMLAMTLLLIGLLCSPSVSAWTYTLTNPTTVTATTTANNQVFANSDRPDLASHYSYTIPPNIIFEEGAGFSGYSLSDNVFQGFSIITLVFNGNVTRIYGDAFLNCGSLTNVTFNGSVNQIRDLAFQDCANLKKITFTQTTPPSTFGSGSFPPGAMVYIPAGANISDWTAGGLSWLAGRIALPLSSRPRGDNEVLIRGSVNVGKGSTLNIGK